MKTSVAQFAFTALILLSCSRVVHAQCNGGCEWSSQTHFSGHSDVLTSFAPGVGNQGGTCESNCTWEPGCSFRGVLKVENRRNHDLEVFDHNGVKLTNTAGGTSVPALSTRYFAVSIDRGCGQSVATWDIKNLAGTWESAHQFLCALCNYELG